MFLSVSVTLLNVNMNDEQQRQLGLKAQAEFRRRFKLNKRSAYTAAGVSPATLDKFFAGENVRPDKMQQLIDTFWPDADGDWRVVLDLPSVGPDPDDSFVSAPGATREAGLTNAEVLAEVRAMRAAQDKINRAVLERLERLEQGAKPVGRARGKGGPPTGPS